MQGNILQYKENKILTCTISFNILFFILIISNTITMHMIQKSHIFKVLCNPVLISSSQGKFWLTANLLSYHRVLGKHRELVFAVCTIHEELIWPYNGIPKSSIGPLVKFWTPSLKRGETIYDQCIKLGWI